LTSYAERSARPAPKSRSRKRATRVEHRPLAGGVAWIVLLAVLLAGVVAVNVAVLQLTMRLDSTTQRQVNLRSDIARLQSELSSAASSYQIQQQARGKLGLVQADTSTTRYIELASK
jgi:cell division protein FtsL